MTMIDGGWRTAPKVRAGDGFSRSNRMTPPTPVTIMVPHRLVGRLQEAARQRGRTLSVFCSELVEVGWAVNVGAIEPPAAANVPEAQPAPADLPTSLAPYGGPAGGALAASIAAPLLVGLSIEEPAAADEAAAPTIAPAPARTVRALRAAGQRPREIAASTGLARAQVLEILGRRR